jgi:hypothetical protein
MEKRQPLQQMLLGKVAIYLQKTETGSMPVLVSTQVGLGPYIRPETLQFVLERAGNTLETIDIGKDVFSGTLAYQQFKRKDGQMRLHEIKKNSAQQKKLYLNGRDHSQSGRKYLPAIHQTRD